MSSNGDISITKTTAVRISLMILVPMLVASFVFGAFHQAAMSQVNQNTSDIRVMKQSLLELTESSIRQEEWLRHIARSLDKEDTGG